MIGLSLAAALQVTVGFAVALVGLPYLLMHQERAGGALVRAGRALAAGSTAWIGVGYLLASAASVELATIGLFIAFTIGIAGYLRRRRGGRALQKARRDQQAAKVLDAMDPGGQHSFASLAVDAWRQFVPWLGQAARKLVRGENLLVVLALAVIAWRQFPPLLAQSAPGTPEGYVQLLGAKSLALNMGVYSQGVYPLGAPLLAALVATTFFFDTLNVLRFLGPLVALLLPLAGGLLALEIADSTWAVFAIVTLLGLTVTPALGAGTVTAWHPLALHLAALFVLLELALCLRSLRQDSQADAWFCAAAGFAAVMADPLAWPFAVGAVLLLALPWLWRRQGALRMVALALLGSSLGLVPIGIGVHGRHAVNAILMAPPALPTQTPPEWLSGTGSIMLLGAAGLAVLLSSLLRWQRLQDDAPLYSGIGLLLLALAAASALPLPALWRSTLALGDYAGLLALPLAVGYVFSLVANGVQYPTAAQGLAMLLAAGGIASGLAPVQPLSRYEVPGSTEVLQTISAAFEAYQWTVISPTQQYSELLGKGWHVELVQFLSTVPITIARDRRLRPSSWPRLPILTPDTFLYVPLVTADGYRPHAQDLRLQVPDSLSAAENLGPEAAILDAHDYAWALAYLHAHPSTSSIYYRSPDLLVLWIRQ